MVCLAVSYSLIKLIFMKKSDSPILVLEGSKHYMMQLGCVYGAIDAFGSRYRYDSSEDAFIREDFHQVWCNMKKRGGSFSDFKQYVGGIL
jgi:hypothetical protein